MKKMIVLTIVMALLLCGCGKKEEPVVQTEPATEAVTEPVATEPQNVTEQTEPVETQEATEAPAELAVKDRLAQEYTKADGENKFCVHLPMLILNGDDQLTINSKMYTESMRKLFGTVENKQPNSGAAYAVGEIEGFASVIISFDQQEYSIYHINTQSGKEATDIQLLSAFGYNPDTFRGAVKKAVQRVFEADNQQSAGGEDYRKALAQTMSNENIAAARPFIDAGGKLCFTIKMYALEGTEYYARICLENPAAYPAPQNFACSVHG